MISKAQKKMRQYLFDKGLKECSNPNCTENNPQEHINFSYCISTWDRFQTRCKACVSHTPQTDEHNELLSQNLKICSNPKCHNNNPQALDNFYKLTKGKGGYNPRCKACTDETTEDYRQTEKGKYNQWRYNRSNERKRSIKKYQGTPQQKATKRRFTESPKGKEKYRSYTVTRRTQKTQAGGYYTPEDWRKLCKFYNFHCLKCDKKFPFKKLHIDHIKPVSKGGSSFLWNLQPLCKKCNSSKGNKEIDYRKSLPDWIN